MSVLVQLARHAHHAELGGVLSGRSDIGLSDEGRVQADRLGAWFADRDVAALYSSPRPRARQTAAAISAATGASPVADDGFDEVDFGVWTGQRFAELATDPAWRHWNEARDVAQPPGGEGMAAATARAWAAIKAVAGRTGGPVVVVSHADIIRGVVAHVLGLPLGRLLAFDVDPASVTTLSVGSWGARLVALNERIV